MTTPTDAPNSRSAARHIAGLVIAVMAVIGPLFVGLLSDRPAAPSTAARPMPGEPAVDATVNPAATPDPAWKTNASLFAVDDCTETDPSPGPNNTDTAENTPCQSYNADVYESLDSGVADLSFVDIDVLRVGYDDNFVYVEWDTVSTTAMDQASRHFSVEFDVDPDAENPRRGDDYIHVQAKSDFNVAGVGSSFIDTFDSGGTADDHADNNNSGTANDVGGPDPGTGDSTCVACPDPSGGQDGYTGDIKEDNTVYARIFGGSPGTIQIAVRWSHLRTSASNGNTILNERPTYWLARGWTSQTSSISKDKLYWHDENTTSDLTTWDHDNTCWGGFVPMGQSILCPLDQETPTPTNTPPTPSPTPTASNTPTPPTPSATPTSSNTPTPPTPSPTPTASNTPTPPTPSSTPTSSNTPTPPTPSPTPTSSNTPTPPTPSPTPTSSNTPTPPTASPTATGTQPPTGVNLSTLQVEPKPDGGAIVAWTTSAEVDVVGFNVYRAASSSGTYDKLNVTLIPATGSGAAGVRYRFDDASGTQSHFYKLEVVGLSGAPQTYGPVSMGSSWPSRHYQIHLPALLRHTVIHPAVERQAEALIHRLADRWRRTRELLNPPASG